MVYQSYTSCILIVIFLYLTKRRVLKLENRKQTIILNSKQRKIITRLFKTIVVPLVYKKSIY